MEVAVAEEKKKKMEEEGRKECPVSPSNETGKGQNKEVTTKMEDKKKEEKEATVVKEEKGTVSGLKRPTPEGNVKVEREGKRQRVDSVALEPQLELKITANAGSRLKLEKVVQQLVEERLRVLQLTVFDQNVQELKERVEKIDSATKHQSTLNTLQAKIARLAKKSSENKKNTTSNEPCVCCSTDFYSEPSKRAEDKSSFKKLDSDKEQGEEASIVEDIEEQASIAEDIEDQPSAQCTMDSYPEPSQRAEDKSFLKKTDSDKEQEDDSEASIVEDIKEQASIAEDIEDEASAHYTTDMDSYSEPCQSSLEMDSAKARNTGEQASIAEDFQEEASAYYVSSHHGAGDRAALSAQIQQVKEAPAVGGDKSSNSGQASLKQLVKVNHAASKSGTPALSSSCHQSVQTVQGPDYLTNYLELQMTASHQASELRDGRNTTAKLQGELHAALALQMRTLEERDQLALDRQAQVQELQEANARLQEGLRGERAENEALNSRMQALQEDNAAKVGEIQELVSSLEAERGQGAALQDQLERASALHKALSSEMEALREENAAKDALLSTANQRADQRASDLEVERRRSKQLQTDLTVALQQWQSVLLDRDHLAKESHPRLLELLKLSSENNALKEQSAEMAALLSSLQNDFHAALSGKNMALQERDKLTVELRVVREVCSESELEEAVATWMAEAEKVCDQLKDRDQQLYEKTMALEKSLISQREVCSSLEAEQRRSEGLAVEIRQLKAQLTGSLQPATSA